MNDTQRRQKPEIARESTEQETSRSAPVYLYRSPLKNMDSCGPMTVTTDGAIRLDAEKTP